MKTQTKTAGATLGKSIFSPRMARILLKNGYEIIDIKPFKENRDKTIFIFKNEDGLINTISRCSIKKSERG